MMASKQFKLGDGGTMLIRAIDVHEEAEAMARRLGMSATVRTMVGRWEESGQLTGWTKQSKGADEVLVEVFVSDAAAEEREFNRYAVEMMRLIQENKSLKAKLAELEPAQ
jgi:hypothetical protein